MRSMELVGRERMEVAVSLFNFPHLLHSRSAQPDLAAADAYLIPAATTVDLGRSM